MRTCTCTGTCKGKEGLAPGWRCAMEPLPPASCSALIGIDEQLVKRAILIVTSHNNGTVSILQRRLGLRYTEASLLLDELERRGVVSAPIDKNTTRRTVLPKPNCLIRNGSGQGTHLEYRHPLSLDGGVG